MPPFRGQVLEYLFLSSTDFGEGVRRAIRYQELLTDALRIGLRIEGVVLTMVDSRNRLSQQVEGDVRTTLGELVFKTVIPRNVRLSEAPSYAQPVLAYDSVSKGSEAYRALAQEVLARHPISHRFNEETA